MGVIRFLRPVPDPFLTLLTQSASVAGRPLPGGRVAIGWGRSGLPGHLKIARDIFQSDGFSRRYVGFYRLQQQFAERT